MAVIAALVLAACGDSAGPSTTEVVSVALTTPAPHVQRLDVQLRGAAPLTVAWEAPGEGPVLRTHSPEARSHSVLLTRLRAGRSYQYRIEGTSHAGTFTTPALPEDLAALKFTAAGAPTTPLVLLHLFDPDGFKGYAIVDGEGEVVWHWRTSDFPFGMARRANGNFVFMDKGRGLVEVTPAGAQVSLLEQDFAKGEMHHDVIATPANTLLFIAFDAREHEGARLLGEAVWEWTPETGSLVQRWSVWDHLSPDTDRGPRFGTEWLHANALGYGPRGNVLVSLHYLNQVISIAPGWGALEWRLHGPNGTITLADDDGFSGQHTAHEVAPGRVLLFDNGLERGGYSRAVEYALAGSAATVVWEWRPGVDNFSAVVSSARRLANGHTLVGFGTSAGVMDASGPTEVFEVSSAGAQVWHLLVESPYIMFRAEPVPAIAGEQTVEASVLRAPPPR